LGEPWRSCSKIPGETRLLMVSSRELKKEKEKGDEA